MKKLWLLFTTTIVLLVFTIANPTANKLAMAASRYTQMKAIQLVDSKIDGTPIGLVTPSTGYFTYVTVAGTPSNLPLQGGYLAWNLTGGMGETDIVNQKGAGLGGINFYLATGSSVPSTPTMRLAPDGSLTVTQVNGNAATASAFDHTPAQCTAGTVAKGITNVGDCISATFPGSTSGNGYTTLPSGVLLEWFTGPTQSDSSGGSGNPSVTLSMPATCPNAVLNVQVSAVTPSGETEGDDTHGPTYAVVSSSRTQVVVQRYRLSDHGSDPSQPSVYVVCY